MAHHVITNAQGQTISTGDMISKAVNQYGYQVVLCPGKKIAMFFTCPACGEVRMVKFMKHPDRRNKIHACICGYRKATPKRHEKHGTFIHA